MKLSSILILHLFTISLFGQSYAGYLLKPYFGKTDQLRSISLSGAGLKKTVVKKNGTIKFRCTNGKMFRFKDNSSDENFTQFTSLGMDVDSFVYIKQEWYNNEVFHVINLRNGIAIKLIGEPVFNKNMNRLIALQGAETDARNTIQIWTKSNGIWKMTKAFEVRKDRPRLGPDIYARFVYWFDHHTILIRDGQDKYFSLDLRKVH